MDWWPGGLHDREVPQGWVRLAGRDRRGEDRDRAEQVHRETRRLRPRLLRHGRQRADGHAQAQQQDCAQLTAAHQVSGRFRTSILHFLHH